MAPIPALLAVAGLHHHLIRQGTRTLVGLVLESAEPRDVHHFALLIGYGASAVNPYLAFESIEQMLAEGLLTGVDRERRRRISSRPPSRGWSRRWRRWGSPPSRAIAARRFSRRSGCSQPLVDKYFTRTASRIDGIGIEVIAEEVLQRHRHAFARRRDPAEGLSPGGQHQWRQDGESHQFGPMTIHLVQQAARTGDYKLYKDFSRRRPDAADVHLARAPRFQISRPGDSSNTR